VAGGDSGELGEDACFHREERDMRHGFFDTAGLAMQTKSQTNNPARRWLTFQDSPAYCGLSLRCLQNYEKAGLIKVANIIQPGATRGRKLICRESLDALIESHVGTITTAPICKVKGGAA